MSSVKCSSSWKATRSGMRLDLYRSGGKFQSNQAYQAKNEIYRIYVCIWYLICSFLMLSVLGFPSAYVDVFCVNVHFTSRRGRQMQKGTSPVIITSFFSCTLGKDLTPSRSTSCTWKSCHSKHQGQQVWFPCQLGLATVP